jgi:hypothetical protein
MMAQKVSPERYQAVVEDFNHGIPLYNQEGLEDIQVYIGAQTALSRLRERDADLADYLRHLDTKVNMMLKRVKGEKSPLDELKMQKANLSGTGMAFITDTPADMGTDVEFHIVLLPAYIYIYCFGKVVSCEPYGEEENRYRIGAEFTLLMEEDREKLIQHNFKQQSLALRNRRLNY